MYIFLLPYTNFTLFYYSDVNETVLPNYLVTVTVINKLL